MFWECELTKLEGPLPPKLMVKEYPFQSAIVGFLVRIKFLPTVQGTRQNKVGNILQANQQLMIWGEWGWNNHLKQAKGPICR